MKGDAKMTFNPSYAEIMGRELRSVRLQEAEQQRMIRAVTLANPSRAWKIWLILRDRWGTIWNRNSDRKIYPPISHIPKNSTSL